MPDSPAASAPSPMLGQKLAFILGTVLVVAFGAVILFTVRENGRRHEIETVSEPRAVGDDQFVMLAQPLDLSKPIARFQGRDVFAAEVEPIEVRDSRMVK